MVNVHSMALQQLHQVTLPYNMLHSVVSHMHSSRSCTLI
jgi:hypothetical protein